ncbi:hypothetical protein BKA60DRAFT_146314 [Fusarium oxysporum]|nr:hypothetical protein BKA60DRAFT_146314 [Fusarium oxysporum]
MRCSGMAIDIIIAIVGACATVTLTYLAVLCCAAYKRSETRQGAGQNLVRNGSFADCQVSVAYRVSCPVVFSSVLLVIVVMVEGLTEIERERVSEKSGSSQLDRSMTSRLDGGLFNTRELDSNVLADAIASEI